VVQHPQDIVMLDGSPGDFSLMRAATDSSRKEQVVLVKVANCRAS
jgi:hypothetical protein